MRQSLPLCTALPLLATLAALPLPDGAAAQSALPPRWTAGLQVGVQLPTWLYDERVTAFVNDTTSLTTAYSERIRTAPLVNAVLRYKPQSEFGAFFSMQFASAGTRATYSGGGAGPQTIDRHVRIWTFGAGLSIRLGEWADGGGSLEYLLGPVLVRHTLDLSNGHRDLFAHEFGAPRDVQLRWADRSWTGWGFMMGATTRFPLAGDLGLRLALHSIVLPVAVQQMAAQEEEDVFQLARRLAVFSYRPYTTYYPSVRVGLEYVLGRMPPRVDSRAALPPPRGPDLASAETRAARAMLARGDTAGAVAALRERVRAAPDDASAWRDLSLLLAADAERSPAARAEAWTAVQRAVALNPDDGAVLAAYGRIASLLQRTGMPGGPTAPRLAVSEIAVQADTTGAVSLSWSITGLARGEDGRVRYRVQVEVIDDAGEVVPLRLADGPEDAATPRLALERDGGALSVSERLELRLSRVRAGAHTLRVSVTSLASGRVATRVAGFEIR
jgi:tetratricopeptide (TPR) repeat protein